ncbi:MAG: hypothetical protein AAF412_00255 [Pseudomonadota bacterium]
MTSPVPSDDPDVTPSDSSDNNPTVFTTTDQDDDGASDGVESSSADRDGDGTPDAQDYDPTGYFYCEEDGRILSGALITVLDLTGGGSQTGVGTSGNITIVQDGSNGFYQFFVTAPGTYRLTATLPSSGVASTTNTSAGLIDVSSFLPANPAVIGSGESGSSGVLADFSAGANPFYTDFEIEAGDPSLFNNNIPLMFCGTPEITAAKSIAAAPTLQSDGSTNLTYRLSAENTGTTQVADVSLVDDLSAIFGTGNYTVLNTNIEAAPGGFGASTDPFYDGDGNSNLITTGGNLEPGETVSVLLEINVAVVGGSYNNTVVGGGASPLTGSPLTGNSASVSVAIGSPPSDAVFATKTTSVQQAPLGSIIPYTLTFENTQAVPLAAIDLVDAMPVGFTYVTGSATVNGVQVEPVIDRWDLTWAGQSIPAGGTVTVQLNLLIGAGVVGTEFINTAYAVDPFNGAPISNRATARVQLEIESVFQCSHVIGRVFDDRDKDGYYDDGEPGLPGVRLASVNGLLITTDQQGRYHVACDAVPDDRIGSNYILKLDQRTLPTGYRVTSENPRVVRLTQGKVSKMNFAAARLRVVSLTLGDTSFQNGSDRLNTVSIRDIARTLPLLEEEPSVLKISYKTESASKRLKSDRLKAARKLVLDAWAARSRPHPVTVEIK